MKQRNNFWLTPLLFVIVTMQGVGAHGLWLCYCTMELGGLASCATACKTVRQAPQDSCCAASCEEPGEQSCGSSGSCLCGTDEQPASPSSTDVLLRSLISRAVLPVSPVVDPVPTANTPVLAERASEPPIGYVFPELLPPLRL